MDDDLKQLLDAIREENASSHAETRQQVQTVAKGLHELQTEVHTLANGQHELQILVEDLRHKVQTVAEGVTLNNEKLERIDAKFDGTTSDLALRVTRLEAAAFRAQG